MHLFVARRPMGSGALGLGLTGEGLVHTVMLLPVCLLGGGTGGNYLTSKCPGVGLSKFETKPGSIEGDTVSLTFEPFLLPFSLSFPLFATFPASKPQVPYRLKGWHKHLLRALI